MHWRSALTLSSRHIGAALLLLVAAAAHVAAARGEYCGTLPATGFDQPPNVLHTGRYLNEVYGYSVRIPAPLHAFTPAAGPDRGFGIVLSWTPRAYLSVDAGYDAFYDIDADGVHRRDLNAMRLRDQVLSDQAAASELAHSAGGRYQTRLRCAADGQVYVHDDVIVVRNREIYRVDLQTVPERHAADVKVLQALLRSWRWAPIAKPYVK
jgi:hypothetical protein